MMDSEAKGFVSLFSISALFGLLETRAAMTTHHKPGGFNNRNLSLIPETRSLRSRCQHNWFLLKALRKNRFHVSLLVPGGLLASPWYLSSSFYSMVSVCMSVSLSKFSFSWECRDFPGGPEVKNPPDGWQRRGHGSHPCSRKILTHSSLKKLD